MTKKQRADLMSVARKRARDNAEPTRSHPTTRVIAVSSGKGGVGKSSASVNLAARDLGQLGFRVGMLDADIWGFSIPRMLGVTERMEADDATRLIQPVEAHGHQTRVDRSHHRDRGDRPHVARPDAVQGARAVPQAGGVG
jgi:Mrp family chromosome partitioning ATPase